MRVIANRTSTSPSLFCRISMNDFDGGVYSQIISIGWILVSLSCVALTLVGFRFVRTSNSMKKQLSSPQQREEDHVNHSYFDDHVTTVPAVTNNESTLVLLPSLFTDFRVFSPQSQLFPNCLHAMNVKQPSNDHYSENLNAVAKQMARYLLASKSDNGFDLRSKCKMSNEYYMGGFCVGGMISLLTSVHLQQMAPELKCKGIILIGSCASFIDCVDDKYLRVKAVLLNLLPRSALFTLVRFYLWINRSSDSWLGQIIEKWVYWLSSDENLDPSNEFTDKKLNAKLLGMMRDKDPAFVTSLLISEFNFCQSDLDWSKFDIPIHHIHGTNDYLMPLHKIQCFRDYLTRSYPNVSYQLTVLKESGHFLSLTRPNKVSQFIHSILNS